MGTIKADTVTGLADPNKATIPNTITMGSTTATLNFGNTVIANASAGSSTITGEGGSNTTNLQQGLAKSLIHYDQINNAIRDSFNVASHTDSAAGLWTYTVTNAYNNIFWQPCFSGGAAHTQINTDNTTTVGSFRARDANANNDDAKINLVQGTGDLA